MADESPRSNPSTTSPTFSGARNMSNSSQASSLAEGPGFQAAAPKSNLDLEPNPFEQSFASKKGASAASSVPTGAVPISAGQKLLLPPVASIASPSSLLSTGTSQTNIWGLNSLRSGPLSPAMLQGPQTSNTLAFVDSHLRTGLTPNESGIRTGLTPGGSGSIFPAPSPTTAAIFGYVPSTPSGLQFGTTPQPLDAITAPNTLVNGVQTSDSIPTSAPSVVPATGAANFKARAAVVGGKEPFSDSASVAANGLFLLSQGQQQQATADAQEQQKKATAAAAAPAKASETKTSETRAGEKRKQANGRRNGRRNEDTNHSTASKRSKLDHTAAMNGNGGEESDSSLSPLKNDITEGDDGPDTRKMTDEEKRKNFLERNRVAALKCRQRKKKWLADLQARVEFYSKQNEDLSGQVTQLREQVIQLKTLLDAHKDCSVSRGGPTGQAQEQVNLISQDYVPIASMAQQPTLVSGMVPATLASGRRFV
ncbi:Aft1 HRA domain-containing protein [Lipomyces oligophaga]|uniref:Aft1 HRA domain-containing protein n=1 Tax=Lipomyces oligophaga TaxID=45792 RepID=UPI0034CFD05B